MYVENKLAGNTKRSYPAADPPSGINRMRPPASAAGATIEKARSEWQNCVGNQAVTPLRLYCAHTALDLVQIIREAEQGGYTVRAVGSGHSFSDVAVTQDYLVDTHGLNHPLRADRLRLKATTVDPDNLFFVEAGIRIRDLNKVLAEAGKGLINAGAATFQTIAGATSTGTHGSGVALGSLADYIESMILIGEGGRVVQIEPADGPSDAAAYLTDLGIQPELIQDDTFFHAACVGMGCFGIIYAVLLRVTPAYRLHECRTETPWAEVRKQLEQRTFERYRHYEVLINPYPPHTCLVTTRTIEQDQSRGRSSRRHRNPLYELLGILLPDEVLELAFRITFNRFPKWTPKVLDMAVRSTRDHDFVADSYKVLDLGSANYLDASSMEIAFPLDQHLAAIDTIFEVCRTSAEAGQQYLSAPIALRYVAPSRHLLAMNYGQQPRCFIEFPVLQNVTGSCELLTRLENALCGQHPIYNYRGRPHWGHLNHLDNQQIRKLYPAFEQWLSAYRQHCKRGTFENEFMRRCGLVCHATN